MIKQTLHCLFVTEYKLVRLLSKSRQIHGITINAILGQSLPRIDKTRDPERDSEPNELVADTFRAGLLSSLISSYPLLAKMWLSPSTEFATPKSRVMRTPYDHVKRL